jgi:hypothetical protein
MTVLEPMRDRAARVPPLLRRAGFVATAAALTAAFGASLSGIASTRATLSADTQAALAAARQQRGTDAGDGVTPRHRCRRGEDRQRSGSGRV